MEYYLYIKALHVVAFVSWMVVLFYLPRLFVYHVENKDNLDFVKVVKVQEKKLYYCIGLPAFLITLFTGISMLILNSALFKGGWFHLKFLFVLLLIVYYLDCGRHLKNLKNDIYTNSGRFYRIYNEFPTVALFIIVFSAILKF